jgi:hypothetical protein
MLNRIRPAALLVLVFLIIGAAACGDSSAEGDSVTVDLQEQNGSGETGTATLEPAIAAAGRSDVRG